MKINGIPLKKALLDAINGMALGLFSTLIVGVIVTQLGKWVDYDFNLFGQILNIGQGLIFLGTVAKSLMGVGIGLGISFALKYKGLKLMSGAIAGAIATAPSVIVKSADPVTTFFVVMVTLILISLVFQKKTPVDIIIIPFFTILVAGILTIALFPPISFVITQIGNFINYATSYQPFLMGFVIGLVTGALLTAPISSAAVMIAIGIGGIAGGAAAVGSSAQMIGFAVQGFIANGIGKSLATAFGTSMIQFKNIVKKPIIWVPTLVVSGILGAFSAQFGLIETGPTGAGMGTSGLVGPLVSIDTMGLSFWTIFWIALFMFILPFVLTLLSHLLFIKLKWYKNDDFKLTLEEND